MKNIFALAALALPMFASAQTEVTFETQDYKSVGVYDTWEASPFRTGALNGNYAVIDNHLTYVDDQLGVAPNPSSKILAIQRSRFGSRQDCSPPALPALGLSDRLFSQYWSAPAEGSGR